MCRKVAKIVTSQPNWEQITQHIKQSSGFVNVRKEIKDYEQKVKGLKKPKTSSTDPDVETEHELNPESEEWQRLQRPRPLRRRRWNPTTFQKWTWQTRIIHLQTSQRIRSSTKPRTCSRSSTEKRETYHTQTCKQTLVLSLRREQTSTRETRSKHEQSSSKVACSRDGF